MPQFGKTSLARLATCHPDIQRIMNEAIKYMDFTIIYGRRGKEDQEDAFSSGHSKKHWPDSTHNVTKLDPLTNERVEDPDGLSDGIDFAPWTNGGVNWHDHKPFLVLAGVIMGIAQMMGIEIIWGGDWDMDGDLSDQRFNDLGHVQRKPKPGEIPVSRG